MKLVLKRICAFGFALLIAISLCTGVSAQNSNSDITILFTHDLHSHLLPSADENGGEFGGYARLMTVIKEQKEKHPDAVLVDGGDFSMGSLFQTAFATSAIELRMMGAMGYDVTTFGNHEFDYLPEGLASMLNVAANCGETVPAIVDANYLPPKQNEEGYNEQMWSALTNYGVKDYTILERGGIYFAIFGITGFDSDACAPNSGMILEDPAEIAQKTVDTAIADCKEAYGAQPVVICLSHSGTENGEGEDYELAKAVNGIDVIVSGHTHTTLEEAIQVNDTYIVSAGEYGKNLGIVTLNPDKTLKNYELIPIDENVKKIKKLRLS